MEVHGHLSGSLNAQFEFTLFVFWLPKNLSPLFPRTNLKQKQHQSLGLGDIFNIPNFEPQLNTRFSGRCASWVMSYEAFFSQVIQIKRRYAKWLFSVLAPVSSLPETNIVPENHWLEDEISFWDGLFSGAMLVWGECISSIKHGSQEFWDCWIKGLCSQRAL